MMWDTVIAFGVIGIETWVIWKLWRRSFSFKAQKWLHILSMMGLYAALSMPLQGGDLENAYFIFLIFMGISIMATKDTLSRKIGMTTILYALILDIKMLAVRGTWTLAGWIGYESGVTEYYTEIVIVEAVLMWLMYCVLKKIIGQAKAIHSSKIWTFLLGIALSTVFMVIMSMLGFGYMSNQEANLFIIAMMIICLLSIIAIFYIIGEIVKGANEEVQKHALQYELEYYEDTKEANEKTRKLLHDMKNHMGTIGAMIYMDKKEEATHYIQEVVGALGEEKSIIYCKNQVANALLHNKVKRMEAKGIHYELKCDLPQEIGLTSMELSSLLGNTIDNAIEACSHIEEGVERFISIKVRYTQNQLFYEIENSKTNTVHQEGKSFNTSKKDKLFHGHGIKQVEHIVDTHEGVMAITHDEKVFKVTVVI